MDKETKLLPTNVTRIVHSISRADDFFDTLQYLLHLAVGDILFHDVQFTIILTAINRNSRESRQFLRARLEEVPLIYTGLKAQRLLLKKSFESLLENDLPWAELEQTKQESINYMQWLKVSRDYYAQIAKGQLSLEDIKVSKLKDYFHGELNPIQKAEKTILEQIYIDNETGEKYPCFKIEEDLYLSVPLIGFAEFDGVAHIIFEAKGGKIVTNYLTGLVIKRFTKEYEELFLDWAMIGENKEKRQSIQALFDEEIWNNSYWDLISNPILIALGYQKRYQKYKEYYDFRLDEANTIPDVLYLQYLRQAITAILIDSYAHNISAHSLTALSWWFRLRTELRDRMRVEEAEELNKLWSFVDKSLEHNSKLSEFAIEELKVHLWEIRTYRKSLNEKYAAGTGAEGNSFINYSGHLSRELYPFFKYLMEKGAYWSGITRDVNAGGKINSFFSILWYGFINNPLFVGTIAKTEDIRRIRVNVTLYKPEENPNPETLIVSREIDFEGVLAEVDLDHPRQDADQNEGDHTLSQRSVFVEPCEAYEELKKRLDAIKVFFPGGVVGKHSFYTMIENEIRNIKHYHGDDLLHLQEEGLTLNISVQPCSLPGSKRRELYLIGIWLKTPTALQKHNDRHLVQKKWDSLYNEITEPITHSPKLGGTHQDKICAAMLFNSRFSSVQNGFKSENRDDRLDTDRDRAFFPWVTPACSPVSENESNAAFHHTDFNLTVQNFESFNKQVKVIPAEFCDKGYLKKYLHLWRFEDTLDLIDGSIHPMENHARFRFVHSPENKIFELRKEHGVVRIITQPLNSHRPEDIYRQWLQIWNEGFPPVLLLQEEGKPNALLALVESQFKLYTADDFARNDTEAQRLKDMAEANTSECVLAIEHKADVVGRPDILRYRNHGSMRTQFWANVDPNDKNINPFRYVAEHFPDRLPELFETLSTRICIFDNRLWQRVRKDIEDGKDKEGNIEKRLRFYRHKLKLVVHGESPTDSSDGKNWLQEWEEELKSFIPNCHFLVLHLSFIERILEAKHMINPAYKAGNIGLFIEKELYPAIERNGRVRDNFFLVVTTGRGRSEWLASLEEDAYREFNRFTIFRPVESLISAVEHSLAIKDDIDLKFRLVKVLFGS